MNILKVISTKAPVLACLYFCCMYLLDLDHKAYKFHPLLPKGKKIKLFFQ